MIKKHVMLTMALVVLMGSTGAWAQGMKIGFIDTERVIEKSRLVAEIRGQIMSDAEVKQEKVETLKSQYEKAQTSLRQKGSVLSDTEREKLEKDVRRVRVEIEEEVDSLNNMLKKAEKERVDPVFQGILEMVRAYGKENGFDLILPGEMVLYGSPKADITDVIIERLNKDYASGKMKAPSATKSAPATPPAPLAKKPTTSKTK